MLRLRRWPQLQLQQQQQRRRLHRRSLSFKVRLGDRLSCERHFTDADLDTFAGVTGDHNPVHLSAEACPESVRGGSDGGGSGRLVHGMLSGSLFSALFARHLPGAIYVRQSLEFRAPVFTQQHLRVEITFEKLLPRRRQRRQVERQAKADTVDKGNSLALLQCRTTITRSDTIVVSGSAIVQLPNQAIADDDQ